MTIPNPGRRRFLAGLAGALGAVGLGAAGLLRAGASSSTTTTSMSSVAAGSSTTSPPPRTNTKAPSATTSSTVAETTTTPPPETTSSAAPETTTTAAPETTTTVAPDTTTAVVASAGVIDVLCKEAWGASAVAGTFTDHTIERLTVHHTAVVLEANSQAPARARQHQAYHQSLGWPDLAYHFLIDANGNVYQGRPVAAVGDTGTDYDPTGHFLVCCEGDFNAQSLPAAQLASLVRMLAWGAVAYGVDPSTLRGHRDVATTTCPGDALYAPIADGSLEASVRDLIAAGAPALEVRCDSVAFDKVAAIESGAA